ncbi:MAG: hypothetical protein WAW41_21570 [Methylobacter sp.]
MSQIPTILISAFVLSACSTMPSGPSVLVLPSADKSFDQFHTDDLMCRQLAHEQIATLKKAPDAKEEGQQNYDISFIQCMYSKGHQVPVPGELMYDNDAWQEWSPPQPPDMPKR